MGVGGVLAVGGLVAYLAASRSSAPTESADSVLSNTPPSRTEAQNADATAGAVREGFALFRDGLGFVRERVNAAEREADRQDAVAGEGAGGAEK